MSGVGSSAVEAAIPQGWGILPGDVSGAALLTIDVSGYEQVLDNVSRGFLNI